MFSKGVKPVMTAIWPREVPVTGGRCVLAQRAWGQIPEIPEIAKRHVGVIHEPNDLRTEELAIVLRVQIWPQRERRELDDIPALRRVLRLPVFC